MPARAPLVLLALLALACPERGEPDKELPSAASPHPTTELDRGALRASLVDGLEAALEDPARSRLGLAQALTTPSVEAATTRLVTDLEQDPALEQAATELFAALQAAEVMRAAVIAYALEHPELDPAELSVGFVVHVGERLTRPAVVATLRRALTETSRELEPVLTRAYMSDAGATGVLASSVVEALDQPGFRPRLAEQLGRDLGTAQSRLERRLADPDRAAGLLTALAASLATPAGSEHVAALLEAPGCADKLAQSLARVLARDPVRAELEHLFALASDAEFDEQEAKRALGALLAQPVVADEARAWLHAIAREPAGRALVADWIEIFAASEAFDPVLLELIG